MSNTAILPTLTLYHNRGMCSRFRYDTETRDAWTMFYLDSASCSWKIGDASGNALPGTILCCPPNVPFARNIVQPGTLRVLVFDAPEDAPLPVYVQPERIREKAVQRLRDDFDEIDQDDTALFSRTAENWTCFAPSEVQQHYFLDIWYELLHISPELPAETETERAVRETGEWLREHFAENCPVAELAARCHFGVTAFTARFREIYGMPPAAYREMLRLRNAAALLSSTEKPISEIAALCGYNNPYYFSLRFHRAAGISPTGYRERSP